MEILQKSKLVKILKKLIFIFLIIINYLLLIENSFPQSGWYQVPLPMNGTIWNIQFLNHNLGWIRMVDTANQNSYLLRTTNGGNNFTIIGPQHVGKFYFFNDTLGYGLGVLGNNSVFSKTTNSGFNWTPVLTTSEGILCFYFVNPDTGWLGMFDGSFYSAIKQTTNGCQSFQTIWSGTAQGGVDDILFTKPSVGGLYYGFKNESGTIARTTNSGVNWINTGLLYGQAMFFLNKDTGWISTDNGGMFKTINNGVNWITEYLPNNNVVLSVSFTNPRIGYGGGGFGHINATTNGGDVWGTQSIPFFHVSNLFFVDSLTGWGGEIGLMHTTNGGGPITKITNYNELITKSFILYQNYPNPFNITTNIKYQISNTKGANVKILAHDIMGRNIKILVNEKKSSGNYEVKFDGENLSTGIYFYSLFIEGGIVETKRMVLIK